MGRPKTTGENTMARFPEGTLARIKAVLQPGEKQADLVRAGVIAEVERRERAARKRLAE